MTHTQCRHPGLAVRLSGTDGNAFSIMGKVAAVLRRNGYADEIEEFMTEAKSGDYDNVIATAVRWVNVS